MRLRVTFLAPVLAVLLPAAGLISHTKPNDAQSRREVLHQSEQWAQVQPHLPNPDTATAAELETTGDILMARRFPDDAIDFYNDALVRGGDVAILKNKIGVVHLAQQDNSAARAYFMTALKANKHYAPAWNNLGVAEMFSRNFSRAISDYQQASKLDSITATYHANAGMAYFDMKDVDNARKELTIAIQIDPEVLQQHGDVGMNALMLGHDHYGEFCFEMADLFAQQKDVSQVHVWLTRAHDNGYDIRSAMRIDAALSPYLKDPVVKAMFTANTTAHRQSVSGIPGGSSPMERNFN